MDIPIIGYQRPRLSLIPPDIHSSLGQEAIELSAEAGLILDDWQAWSLVNMLGIRLTNHRKRWAAFEVLEIVGRQNGKGGILEARELAGLFIVKTDIEIIHTAHEFKTARKHFYRLKYLIDNTPRLTKRVDKISEAHGQEAIVLLPTPTRIMGSDSRYVTRSVTKQLEIIARSQGSGRGFTGDCLVYDEAMNLDALKVGATLPTLSARPNPQVIYMASAGFKTSTQLARVRRRGVAGTARSLFFAEWSIQPHDDYCEPSCHEHDDPEDIESLKKSNPALGIRITPEYCANEREAFEGGETEWLRERLGVGEYPAPLEGWLVIPKKWWQATEDSGPWPNNEPPHLSRPVFAIHISPDHDWSAVVVAGVRPDERIGIEVVNYRAGEKWLINRCQEIQKRWHPTCWVLNKRSAAGSMIHEFEKINLKVQPMNAQDVSHACGQLFAGIRDDIIWHYDQPSLRKCVAAVDRRFVGEGWVWDERNAAIDISPLIAATFAVWGYQQFGSEADYEISESVHFDLDEIIRLCRAGAYGSMDIARLRDEGLLDGKDLEALANAGISV